MDIPYFEIPIRTSKDRLGKYALMGFLERYVEEMEDEYERQKAQVSGKGQDAYQSDL